MAWGEVEGHYHPVVRPEYIGSPVGHISAPILHDAMQGMDRWKARHIRYAQWQDAMDARKAWPDQGRGLRAIAKRIFRHLPKPARAAIAFAFSYIILQGFETDRQGLVTQRSVRGDMGYKTTVRPEWVKMRRSQYNCTALASVRASTS